ncbi:MAG: hypothetical protein CVU47_01370 [Chloroflexi bacterium HGW-Chloroflexi-9]|nr:MAG: hypothetical protein CVU47_01370 [Chloroflexi bacterium HGW-Chloroflexi-9]
MLGAVALLPGSFSPALAQTAGTPPPPPPAIVTVTVVVNGDTETIVTTPGGLATVVLPPGSAVTTISLTVTTTPASASAEADTATLAVTDFVSNLLGGTADLTGSTSTVLDGETVELAYVFTVSFGGSASNAGQMFVMSSSAMLQVQQGAFLQTGTELPEPATGILNVLPETLAQAGGDLSRLSVYFVDPNGGIFEPVKMLPSPAPGQLAFEFTKEGAYAILVNVVTAEATVAPAPANTGISATTEADRTGTDALLAGTVLATIALGGLGLRFARRRA